MLKVPKRPHLLAVVATAFTAAAFAGSVAAGSALADGGHQWESNETPPTLNGDWAPVNRCPVDSPTILAADGETNIAFCLASNSPSGSFTMGNLTLPTKDSNLQMGLSLSNTTGMATVVAPPGGAVLDEPIEIPDGLQALICPSAGRVAWQVCRPPRHGRDNEHSNQLTNLTVSVVSAGDPSNFNLIAGLQPNLPLISLPVMIHLQNPLFGNHCYIGSETEPIVLQPENTVQPTGAFEPFEANGTPNASGGVMTVIKIQGTQASSSFAVPAASGCGFRGIFDEAINAHAGLPSAAGKNKLVLNESTTDLVAVSDPSSIVPNDGKELSKNWHAAVKSEENEENEGWHHHRHGH